MNPAIAPPSVPEDFVLGKAEYFTDVQLWPTETKLNTDGWLKNFLPDEKKYAFQLLNAFLYFSAPLTEELFKSAFHRISREMVDLNASYASNELLWSRFRHSVAVTHVTGEQPNSTDSGYIFARKARQLLRVDEDMIFEPSDLVQYLIDHGPRPVVFVDDFVGSGNQFSDTWKREIELRDGTFMSFQRLAAVRGFKFYYCPAICSKKGQERIARDFPNVVLSTSHVLSERYCATAPNSLIWPDSLRTTAQNFLETVSKRAGISNWEGFHGLGLALAFEHGPPDATLPIFYHEGNGWIPLVKRT